MDELGMSKAGFSVELARKVGQNLDRKPETASWSFGGAAEGGSSAPTFVPRMTRAIEDAYYGILDQAAVPAVPLSFSELLSRLLAQSHSMPPLYRSLLLEPFVAKLQAIGPEGFQQILTGNRDLLLLMTDISQAVLQNGEGYLREETDAFQEVCSDLYDGYLSAADRKDVEPPDQGAVAPLVKWGNPEFGPYTFTVGATSIFDVGVPVVSMPPGNAARGMVAWGALPHEVCGHDVLHADTGLTADLREAITDNVAHSLAQLEAPAPVVRFLAEYWATRVDETASDVIGTLNAGPAIPLALIAYFRALRGAFAGTFALSRDAPLGDPHAGDVLRGLLGAVVVAMQPFTRAQAWGRLILQETLRDLDDGNGGLVDPTFDGRPLPLDLVFASARATAAAICFSPMISLENHALAEIQTWRDEDEWICGVLRQSIIRSGVELPDEVLQQFYAAHVVAAGVNETLFGNRELPVVFQRSVRLLKTMHDSNPAWGPLMVANRGAIWRRHSVLTGLQTGSAQGEVAAAEGDGFGPFPPPPPGSGWGPWLPRRRGNGWGPPPPPPPRRGAIAVRWPFGPPQPMRQDPSLSGANAELDGGLIVDRVAAPFAEENGVLSPFWPFELDVAVKEEKSGARASSKPRKSTRTRSK